MIMGEYKLKDGKLTKTETVETEYTVGEINEKIARLENEIGSLQGNIDTYQTELDYWLGLKSEFEKLEKK